MYTKRCDDAIRIHLIRNLGEAELYSDILTRRHYLENSAYNRNTIVHVARRGRKDVAILTWECGTRHRFGKRDRLIGWTAEQKAQRLQYCIENRRFLMLVEGETNLASHILALSTARLALDATAKYGHDVVLAETFVDSSRGLEGTCYRAAGWVDAGLTSGGHGRETWSRKLYFVKELKQDALVKLRAPELSSSDTTNPRQSVLFLEQLDIAGLKARLETIPDYRVRTGNYQLVTLLALIMAAILGGASDAKAIYRWIASLSVDFLKSLGCRQAPSYTTVWRVLTKVGHAALQKELCGWLADQSKNLHVAPDIKHLCLDGKTLRTASKAHGSQLHVVTMIEAVSKTIMEQRLTDDKSNEIPKVVEILEAAPIDAQTIVTADAMHTQHKTAETIQKKTATTSSRSKRIKPTCAEQSLTTLRLRPGLNRTLQRIVRTGA